MESPGEGGGRSVDRIAHDDVEQLAQDPRVFFDKFCAHRHGHLPGVTARPRMSIEIRTYSDQALPVCEMLDDPVRFAAQPRFQGRASLPRFVKSFAKRSQ